MNQEVRFLYNFLAFTFSNIAIFFTMIALKLNNKVTDKSNPPRYSLQMIFSLLNILLAVVPSLVLVIYFYRQDRKSEPVMLVWKVFVLGFFSVIPAAALELFLEPFASLSGYYQNLLARAFIVAAVVEEGIKLLVVMLYVYKKKDFDEVTDGIVYTITASLGFACFENILYSSGGLSTVLLRAFSAVPLHAIASGIMGFYIGKSKFGDRNAISTGFAAAVFIHGLYDFLLFRGGAPAFLVIPLLIICWFILKRKIREALRLDREYGNS